MMDTGILPHITVGCFGGESFQAADQKTDFSYFDSTLWIEKVSKNGYADLPFVPYGCKAAELRLGNPVKAKFIVQRCSADRKIGLILIACLINKYALSFLVCSGSDICVNGAIIAAVDVVFAGIHRF